MKNTIRKLAACGKGVYLALILLTISAISSQAQDRAWTTVGSAGTVNDEDYDRVELFDAYAMLAVNVPTDAPAKIRYNVVAVDGLFDPLVNHMKVRFRDTGNNARVRVFLRRYSTGGILDTLMELDSNDFPPSNNYQTQYVYDCNGLAFSFSNNAYFIEVELTGDAQASRVAMIQLYKSANNCGGPG